MELPSTLLRFSDCTVTVLSPLIEAAIPPERVLWEAEAPTEMAPDSVVVWLFPRAMAISTPPVTASTCSSLVASIVRLAALPLAGALMVLAANLAVIGLVYLFSAPAPAPAIA